MNVLVVMRALYGTDYQRVVSELKKVHSQLDMLIKAVEDYGFSIECCDDGNIKLVKYNP